MTLYFSIFKRCSQLMVSNRNSESLLNITFRRIAIEIGQLSLGVSRAIYHDIARPEAAGRRARHYMCWAGW